MSSDERTTAAPRPPRVPEERPGRPGGKRDANRRRRIRQLCEAGLRLFLADGVVPVTIDRIVREAGMAKASFYRYLRDKEELVATILAPLRDAVEAALDTCEAELAQAESHEEMLEAYQGLGAALARLLASQREPILLYLQEARAPGVGPRAPVRALADLVDARALRLTEAAASHGLWRSFDPHVSSLAVVGAVERLLLAVLRGEYRGDPTRIPGALASLVLDGLRNG
ncbi:MAG: TetR/AcrR family transcriptional regulator [Myxococcota bacterium]